tara:strand:- start:385 stop:528 length:144 start_codon:yes stop_codon:yes gene_type:complete
MGEIKLEETLSSSIVLKNKELLELINTEKKITDNEIGNLLNLFSSIQ